MECTQQELLDALKESGRNGWTPRLMTSLREEGFLPPLKRRPQPGTNKPMYVWEEDDFDQIVDAYDWWNYYGGNREPMARALWLDGSVVPLDQLRDPYLDVVEVLQQKLTHGQTELDDILDEISQSMVKWSRKFRFSPKLTSERKKLDVGLMERVVEPMMVALAIPEQMEPTAEIIQSFLSDVEDEAEETAESDEEFLNKSHMVAAILRDILTLENLREVLETATPAQWEQAREDYYEIGELMGEFVRRANGPDLLESLEEIAPDFKPTGAMWLIPPLLSTRYRGHGHWIDKAFSGVREFFASPAFEDVIEKQRQERENRTVEAHITESEQAKAIGR